MITIADPHEIVRTGSISGTDLPFTLSEYRRRLDAVVAKFASFGVDAMVVTSNVSQQYLTGHYPHGTYFRPYPLIITPAGKPTYVVRTYDEDAVRAESWIDDVVPYTQQSDFAPTWVDSMRRHKLEAATVGLELGTWNVSPADVRELQSRLPDLKIVDATRLVPSVAAVKSQVEIETMRASAAFADIAIRKFYEFIRPGVTELEAVAAIVQTLAERGTTLRLAMLQFGQRTALPHGGPSRQVLERDQPAMAELSGFKSGYAAGLNRSAVLGHHAEAEQLHEVARQALVAAIAAIRPGALMGDVDAAMRRVLSDAGKLHTNLSRTGYQNGIQWGYRGGYSLEPGSTDVIERGMTFHMPIILFERGRFGVGVSQTVVVTESGAEPLSAIPPALYRAE